MCVWWKTVHALHHMAYQVISRRQKCGWFRGRTSQLLFSPQSSEVQPASNSRHREERSLRREKREEKEKTGGTQTAPHTIPWRCTPQARDKHLNFFVFVCESFIAVLQTSPSSSTLYSDFLHKTSPNQRKSPVENHIVNCVIQESRENILQLVLVARMHRKLVIPVTHYFSSFFSRLLVTWKGWAVERLGNIWISYREPKRKHINSCLPL